MKLHHAKLIGKTWYYQRGVPKKLQAQVGKKVWKECLHTSDVTTAKGRIAELDRKTDAIIKGLGTPPQERFAAVFAHLPEEARQQVSSIIGPNPGEDEFWQLVKTFGEQADRYNAARKHFEHRILQAEDDADKEIAAFTLEKKYFEPFKKVGRAYLETYLGPFHTGDANGCKIADALTVWERENKPKPSLLAVYKTAARRFVEVNGDLPLDQITERHCGAFKEAVADLPDTSNRRFHGKTVGDCIAIRRSEGLPTISAVIVQRNINAVKALLDTAKSSGMITANPMSDIKVAPAAFLEESDEKSKVPFTDDDINKILAAVAKERKPTEDDFWFFPIALLTGARIDEIGRMLREHVMEEDGIPYFHMRILKPSKRKSRPKWKRVPVHKHLIEAGFLDFVKSRSDVALFHTCAKPDKLGRYTQAISKRLAHIQRNVAMITDPSKTFHSTRHAFEDAARNSNIPIDFRRFLVGRTSDIPTEDTYGNGTRISVLNTWLQQVEYPGVDWSLLRQAS